jgi:hypothetical protein
MKFQIVTPYRVSHVQRYGVTVRGNVASLYTPLHFLSLLSFRLTELMTWHWRYAMMNTCPRSVTSHTQLNTFKGRVTTDVPDRRNTALVQVTQTNIDPEFFVY